MEEIKDWYIANTGYVLQLATPYYEELTVRENLTLAAKLRLAKNFDKRENAEDDELKFEQKLDDDEDEGAGRERGKLSHLDKIFERIEQVMQVVSSLLSMFSSLLSVFMSLLSIFNRFLSSFQNVFMSLLSIFMSS